MSAMTNSRVGAQIAATLLAAALALAGCGENTPAQMAGGMPGEQAEADFERGPHNGRLLRSGDLALEITVFETGVPPEFRVFPYLDDRPLDPTQLRLEMAVSRLGGRIDRFTFVPQDDFLRAQSTVVEPHSFDVSVAVEYGGERHTWTYASYEGRTTIARDVADAAGVAVEKAGPAVIEESMTLAGRVDLLPEGQAELRALYPGRIVQVTKHIGDPVRRGEVLARIEASSSLQTYAVTAPMDGVIAEHNASLGGTAGMEPLFIVMDPTRLHAELFLFPQDSMRVRVGQPVSLRAITGEAHFDGEIESILARPGAMTPMRIAHVELPAEEGNWWPGMALEARVVVGTTQVPLAVRTRALQRFRDFTVVYGRFGDTYEVRMLELGRQTPEWTEVLGGLEPGTEYVTDNAFLIRADVEKSGAVHDH